MIDPAPLLLTLYLASVTALLLFIIAIPLAYWLAYSRFPFKIVLEVVVSMPLVLPPTVLGFYLLLFFSQSSFLGRWLYETLGIQFVFSFSGLVLASILYSLPFMVHPILSGFRNLPPSLKEASYLLGKSRWETLFKVLLPNIRTSILIGIVLTFAHTIGEFGVVLMIGGNIPGLTKVASIAVYDAVEALDYQLAHIYSGILFTISFVILLLVYWGNNQVNKSGII